jgi:hypothetical protein
VIDLNYRQAFLTFYEQTRRSLFIMSTAADAKRIEVEEEADYYEQN